MVPTYCHGQHNRSLPSYCVNTPAIPPRTKPQGQTILPNDAHALLSFDIIALTTFSQTIPTYIEQRMDNSSRDLAAMDYANLAEQGKATHTGTTTLVRASASDFVADVEKAARMCLTAGEHYYFVTYYLDRIETPVVQPDLVASRDSSWEAVGSVVQRQHGSASTRHYELLQCASTGAVYAPAWDQYFRSYREYRHAIRGPLTEKDSGPVTMCGPKLSALSYEEACDAFEEHLSAWPENLRLAVSTRDRRIRVKLGAELRRRGIAPTGDYFVAVDVRTGDLTRAQHEAAQDRVTTRNRTGSLPMELVAA